MISAIVPEPVRGSAVVETGAAVVDGAVVPWSTTTAGLSTVDAVVSVDPSPVIEVVLEVSGTVLVEVVLSVVLEVSGTVLDEVEVLVDVEVEVLVEVDVFSLVVVACWSPTQNET